MAPELRKDWDAMIQLGQNDVVETTTTIETSEDAAGDVLTQSRGELRDVDEAGAGPHPGSWGSPNGNEPLRDCGRNTD